MFLSAVKVLEVCEIHTISAQKEPLLFILADPFEDNVFMTCSEPFNNSLYPLPNSKLANKSLESFSVIKLATMLWTTPFPLPNMTRNVSIIFPDYVKSAKGHCIYQMCIDLTQWVDFRCQHTLKNGTLMGLCSKLQNIPSMSGLLFR